MAAWKQQRAREGNISLRDKLLVQTDWMGKIGSLTAPLINGALRNRFLRNILERIVGIHRQREILPFQTDTFSRWWSRKPPVPHTESPNGKVAFFPGCLVTYQAPDIGKAAVQVLEKNGVEVVLPSGQQCCGMPRFDLGDTEGITQAAESHLQIFGAYVEQGYDIVIPAPSCSLMFKREYPYFRSTPDMKRLAEHTFDLCEYLMRLKRDHRLSLDFPDNPGRVAYQIPCHLRDQNIGFKSKELMELTGATVHLIEKCSGHDGAWSAKTEFFDLSMKIASKATRDIVDGEFDIVASDCPLSALQLKQALGTKNSRPTLHPIQIIRNAYGMPS
jgi:glycerol-3-phosphate dehydrogenase subunit C